MPQPHRRSNRKAGRKSRRISRKSRRVSRKAYTILYNAHGGDGSTALPAGNGYPVVAKLRSDEREDPDTIPTVMSVDVYRDSLEDA